MVTEARNQPPFSAHPPAVRIHARTNLSQQLQARVLALSAHGLAERRVMLHFFILAVVITAMLVARAT